MSDTNGISIGDAAKASGLAVKTIRYYEQLGLIPKAPRHDSNARTGGNRYYTEAEIGRLRFIYHARALNLGLDDIRALLAVAEERGCPGEQPEYRRILMRHMGDIDERMDQLQRLRTDIEMLLSRPRSAKSGTFSWTTCDCCVPGGEGRKAPQRQV